MKGLLLMIGALSLANAQTPPQFTTIHSFQGFPNDGAVVKAPLVRGGNVLYGTTVSGGGYSTCGCGVVYSLTPPTSPGGHWTEKILYNFTGDSDGGEPEAGLAIDAAGVLYGTTDLGGSTERAGTVFSLTAPGPAGGAWTETVLHNFSAGRDGRNPVAGVTIGREGALYGTTAVGGTHNSGTVFALRPPASPGGAWDEKILYDFSGGNDGGDPMTGLTIDPASGTLYGTTYGGGASLEGTVFSLTPPATAGGNWTQKTIFSFPGWLEGGHPSALLLGPGGILYGTAQGLGGDLGTVFSLTPPGAPGGDWTFDMLHIFSGPPDGADPMAGLIMSSDGMLYGTTVSGGTGACLNGCGTVFSLAPPAVPGGAWTETVLFSFDGPGYGPSAPVIFGSNGALYGSTEYGGTRQDGTVFALELQ